MHCNVVISGNKDENDAGKVHNVSSATKFQDAVIKHQEAAQKHLQHTKDDNYSSDDDDDDDDDDVDDKDVFGTLVKSFNLPSGDLFVILLILSSVTQG